MTEISPFVTPVVFHLGPVPITEPVVVTWGIIAVLAVGLPLIARRMSRQQRRLQVAAELLVSAISSQIEEALKRPAAPFLPFIGSLFLFIVTANLCSLLPGVEAPTARLETDAALALIVFAAPHFYGIRAQGWRRHLARYLQPSILLLPLNILSELTRTFSLMVRLFGNMMSHAVVIALLLAIAGLLVPVPLMALGILIGIVQAYIFTVLATLFLGAAVGAFEAH
jgi:F-type H+-transporting ATPase subunit a